MQASYGMEEFVDCVCCWGNASAKRALHTLFVPILTLCLLFSQAEYVLSEAALPIVLSWDEPTKNEDESCLMGNANGCSKDLAGYRIYRSASTNREFFGAPTLRSVVAAPRVSFTDATVVPGTYYRYLITSVDTHGNESGRSSALDSISLSLEGDEDKDGKINALDNCPLVGNPLQEDSDGNGLGDACPQGHILAPLPPKPSCEKDLDGDGVCDVQDNCPKVSNPKQLDSNSDGVGDACSRRTARPHVRCQSREDSKYSSIALLNDSRILLLDAETNSVASEQVAAGSVCQMVADLDATSSGPSGFGDLEVVLSSSTLSAELQSTSSSTSEIAKSPLVLEPTDKVVGCYLDADNELDPLVVSGKRVHFQSSEEGTEYSLDLNKYGKLRQVNCGDTNGDGLDELVLLHKPRSSTSSALPTNTITILNPLSAEVLSSYPTDTSAIRVGVADLKGNAKGTACVLSKVDETRSSISCSKNGKRKLLVPAATDFTVGTFAQTSGKQGFIVLGRKAKLSVVDGKGKVSEPDADLTKALEKALAGRSRKISFVNCR